ncbi:serine hydrolase [uncultured Brevundimonas sp.]|uniref:serine hydrolase n=1 Tax=uncultured Brevundimonas sp. TaxID=213418 RepID=UPI0030ED2CC6|tara:strand:+ start:6371 stop:7993 length:1623 start_codon:yes stop_codon:yes gene_type:complete
MSIRLTRRAALATGAASGAVALAPLSAWAQAAANDHADLATAVDAYVTRCLAAFPDQPGLAVALVKDGAAILTRGYGVRKMGEARRVDDHTLFAIASNSKNVTAAGLAMMVDAGRVKWDEPVRTYLPGFTLSDPVIGERITVRDTLSHRAGFGLGAGDLLFWPNSDRSREAVMARVPFVPIEHGFRAGYHYCNLMFVVAGEVLAAASGQRWEDFVQTRILDRVGMGDTVPMASLADSEKSALPHARTGPPLRYQGPMRPIADSIAAIWNWDSAAAAGGLCASAADWSKWIAVRLAMGALPDGSRLFSEATAKEMWRPNVIVNSSEGPTAALPGRAIAATYAMGWSVQDYRGERLVSHGGGSPGGISATMLIPGRNVGFSVFSNAEESHLLRALRSGITDICMAKTDFDWVADSVTRNDEGIAKSLAAAVEIDAKQAAGAPPSLPLSAYAGTWRDPWYGDVTIEAHDLQLWLSFTHNPALQGPLEPYDGDTMRTRFPDTREEDAFITFELEDGHPVRATVKGVSPDIDFSYDYQDLKLVRI